MSWKKELDRMLGNARAASFCAAQCSPALKKKILLDVAARMKKKTARLVSENKKDLAAAKTTGLSAAMIDRLTLTPERV
ncbi:MAG TPA: gamma-glutamyl-phosphate reductase, partial [Candidatus Omnitrophota bacterium]|nr:gamma-glutamyl-phosphate reductase [Candidatus Omnitrophota bacterium]